MNPARLDCTQVLAQLPLYAGGDLESPGAEALALHLADCAPCGARLEQFNVALAALGSLRGRRDAAIDVWPAVRAGLEREGVLSLAASAGARPLRSRSSFWRLALPLAAAAAVVAVLWFGWRAQVPATSGEGGAGLVYDAPSTAPQDAPSEEVASNADLDEAVPPSAEPSPAGGLRRASPVEERMRRRARQLPSLTSGDSRGGPWSLASGPAELR